MSKHARCSGDREGGGPGPAGRSQLALRGEPGGLGQRVGQQRATWLVWIRLLLTRGGISSLNLSTVLSKGAVQSSHVQGQFGDFMLWDPLLPVPSGSLGTSATGPLRRY